MEKLPGRQGGETMTQLRIVAVAALALVMLAADGMAQRRTGGAVSSGVRGAMVGGLVGGEGAAKKGAAIGAVAGATRTVTQRSAVNAEAQARAQYQSSAQYQNAQHSNFNEAPPEVLAPADGSAAGTSKDGKAAGSVVPNKDVTPVETVLRKAGKPVVGITYPTDWKLKAEDRRASAVSADGQGWSVIALLEGVKDKEAGITKAKQGLEKSLKDIKYDEPTETERGALVVTGTGKGKKAGVEVVFAVGVFESGPGQLAGAAFVVDKDVEDHYKETVRSICETIRGEKDLTDAKEGGK
jgi:hypothetical protein